MAYLKADVVQAVLEDLGVLDRAGNVNANDSARVGARFDASLAGLAAADVVTLNPSAIGDAYFLPLVGYVAQQCALLFHREVNAQQVASAVDELRRQAREAATVADTATNRLAVRALRTLGRISPTANPSAKELATITAQIALVLKDLDARNIITLASVDAAETVGATDALLDFLILTLAAEQAQPIPPNVNIPTRQEAEARLHVIAREAATVTDNATNRLAVRVLRTLGRIGPTAYPYPKELATVTGQIAQLLADLNARSIITLTDAAQAESIGATDALLDFVAATLAPEQAQPVPDGARIPTRQEAETRLYVIAREAATVTDNATNRLAVRALRTLGRIGPTANPYPKELATVTGQIAQILLDLNARAIITLTDAAQAETMGATDALLDFVVATLAPEQAQPIPAGTRIPTRQDAEARLLLLSREAATVTDNATNRLAVRVLRALGRLSPTANPTAKELATVTARIDQILRDLEGRKVIILPDVETAEDMGATEALKDFVIATLATEQAQPLSPAVSIPTRQEAERRLRGLAQPEPVSVQQAVYF